MPISKPLYLDDTAGPKMPQPKRLRQRVPYPIAELPAELKGPDHRLLLFCGDQGGWRLGFWSEDGWRDVACLKDRLEPSHFALASGMREENGRWFPATSNGRMMFWWAGGIALALLAMLGGWQVVYCDSWGVWSSAFRAF